MRSDAVDCVIFDIDNVLVDTRHSYLDAVRWTVEIFLTSGKVPHFVASQKKREPQLLSLRDVEEFKLLGGFNDDWDCCYGLLIYLLSLPVKSHRLSDLKSAVNIAEFSKRVDKRPLKVNGIVKMLGRQSSVTIEKISRIFQEVYLGNEIFRIVEKKTPVYWKKRGLIRKEKPIFRKSTIEKLIHLDLKLGVATGRSRFEAMFALKRFGIDGAFAALTTMDEVKKAEKEMRQSLRKPHPFSILATAKKLGADKKFLYVGDLPDDILAANQAKASIRIKSVAHPWKSSSPQESLQEIKKMHPDYILFKPSDLIPIALGYKTRASR
jgi:HAD superfamily hydrolase (TIGR01548 family)